MSDILSIVVSGRTFSVVSEDIIKRSFYFRALLSGNYKDSHYTVYKFSGWSTKAFEFLLNYIITGRVVLKWQSLKVIRKAFEISEYLLVDGFKPELARELVRNWTDMDSESVFQLAHDLDVRKDLEEYSLIRILSAVDKEQGFHERINFDILILVTGMEDFWNVKGGTWEWHERLWIKLIQRYCDVLGLAIKLPPHTSKARFLVANLRVHILDERIMNDLIEMLRAPSPIFKCLSMAFEKQLAEIQLNIRNVLSHIRIPFSKCGLENRTYGVAEFNLTNWLWNVKQYEFAFKSSECVINKRFAAFLGKNGLHVIRNLNSFPTSILFDQLGNIQFSFSSYDQVCHAHGEYIFILSKSNNTVPKLYKLDVFSQVLSECVSVPVQNAKLKAHRGILYIVGYSLEETNLFIVYKYEIDTNMISVIARSYKIKFSIVDVVIAKRIIYVLGRESFSSVHTPKGEDQHLNIISYKGLVPEMWAFKILTASYSLRGIFFLLKVTRTDWYYGDLMIAQLNPKEGMLDCLGILPKALEEYYALMPPDLYRPQMELKEF